MSSSRYAALALLSAVSLIPMGSQAASRIVGGQAAAPGEFSSIVSLQSSSYGHFCGGNLIRSNWVLTAAHCVKGTVAANKLKIKVGLYKLSDTSGVETFGAKKVIIHPQYEADGESSHDYALIQLSGDSKFEPIGLNDAELTKGDSEGDAETLITAGWGTTSEGAQSVSQQLMKVEVPHVSTARCEAAYPGSITDTMICAGFDAGGKDSCQGDSGGPLMTKTDTGRLLLVGVVSWGEGCARPNKYGVYSKVSAAVKWVDETISATN